MNPIILLHEALERLEEAYECIDGHDHSSEMLPRIDNTVKRIHDHLNVRFIVEVRGGIAYCNSPDVKIIDYDNRKR